MDNADIDCRGKPLATTYLQSAVQTFETLGLPDVFPTGVLFAVCLTATPTPTTVLLRENATCLDPVPRQSQSSFRARNAIMTSLIYSIAISMHRTLSAAALRSGTRACPPATTERDAISLACKAMKNWSRGGGLRETTPTHRTQGHSHLFVLPRVRPGILSMDQAIVFASAPTSL